MIPGGRGPAPALPLAHLVAAATAFLGAAVALPWLAPELAGHYYHPRLLALTHTVTLGWITLTIMGASYQLIPVLLETSTGSPRRAWWVFTAYAIGVVGVVGHFAIAEWRGFVWSAALVALAALAYVVLAGVGVLRARPSFTRSMLAVALGGLVTTALAGTALGLNKIYPLFPGIVFPALHAHVHIALLGWVLPTVLAVSARVYPMFMVAPEPRGIGAGVQLGGILAGAPLVAAGLLLEIDAYLVAGAALAAAAVGSHIASVVTIVRRRRRPALDWGLRFVLAGTAFLGLGVALGLALATGLAAGPRAAMAYGVLALGGWASSTIVGMMLKIVPFLVWYHVYGPRAGRTAVPTLADLSWGRGEAIAFAALVPGWAALALGAALGDLTLLRLAGMAVATGALALAATLGRVLGHLLRARAAQEAAAPQARAAS